MHFLKRYRSLVEWVALLLVVGIVLGTDLRVPVISTLQRGLLATGLLRPNITVPVQLVAATAYPDVPLLTLEGQPTNLQALRGKVVFLNLWATWCPPCVAELPGIQQLATTTDPQRIAFVLVSLDHNPKRAQAFVRRRNVQLPVYFPAAPLPAPFKTESIPATFILGPDGRVLAHHEGMADYSTPEFQRYLEELAK